MDISDHLDVLGQQPGLSNLYTQICCCFAVVDASSHSRIISTLTYGLERLSASFPWVAGQVVNEGSGVGDPGIYRIKALEKIPRLVVRDLREDPSMPTMDALRRANFPFRMLDENIIAPRNTLPTGYDESESPIFLLQATFITGGLLLTFVGQHNVMDMTGQGQIIDLLSKTCRHERFSDEDLSSGNLDRRNVIPLLDDSYTPGPELTPYIAKATPSATKPTDGPLGLPKDPRCSWAYFTFPPTSLAALKTLATKTITLSSQYISTDDALSAFIWQSIIRVRLPRLDPTAEVTLARAVDGRRYLDIPLTYTGLVQNMTYHTYTAQELVQEPLGGVASLLRLAVDPRTSNVGYQTRALATILSRTADKSRISVTATLDLSADIMLSSWAKQDFYDLEFNLGLGKPEAVRRPLFPPVESLIYLMPKALDGEIAVALCLRDEDMQRLRADDEFAKYGIYIG
ncbi:putative trichothecene 3-O-acetyltransferase [Crassisporium funariophilum]|nr:putative trichothecene 3-O-acetyltransferase [Crassisporium funariophilum]